MRALVTAIGCTHCCWWLTLVSTTVVGAGLAAELCPEPSRRFTGDLDGYVRMWQQPSYLLQACPSR